MRAVTRILAPLAATLAAGCGSTAITDLPTAAEPARSPPLTAAPAGDVTRVGEAPEGIVVDPTTGLAAVALRDALALVERETGRVVRRVPLPGGPRHLALAGPGGPVLVPAETADRLLEVGLPGGRVLTEAPVGDQPHDAAAAGPPGRVFVGDERANTMTVLERGRVVATVPVATQPGGVVAARDGTLLAVISVRERVAELFDPVTLRRLGEAPAGVGPTHAVANARYLYVTDTRGGALLVFRMRPELRLVRRVFLPGRPYGVAIDGTRGRLFVTLTERNELVELPAHGRPHVVRRWSTVRAPYAVATEPVSGQVLVVGKAEGELQRLDP